MLPWFNEAMKPSFKKYLKPGARIVAHDFGIEGWEPDKTVKLPDPEKKVGGLSTITRCICGESAKA